MAVCAATREQERQNSVHLQPQGRLTTCDNIHVIYLCRLNKLWLWCRHDSQVTKQSFFVVVVRFVEKWIFCWLVAALHENQCATISLTTQVESVLEKCIESLLRIAISSSCLQLIMVRNLLQEK